MVILILALSILALVGLVARLRLHPALALLAVASATGLSLGLTVLDTLRTMQEGFGALLGQIGLTVVLGTLLGQLLERSGAAMRLAVAVLAAVGPRRPALAVAAIGYLVGIPVFCDSGFVLVSRIHAGLHARTGVGLPTLAMALTSGVFATHTLVPPTPGPIAAAGNLGLADQLGWVLLLGAVTAAAATAVGAWYALRVRGGEAAPAVATEAPPTADQLPPLAWAVAPVAAPVLLIALSVSLGLWMPEAPWLPAVKVLGHPLVALSLGVALAAWIMRRQRIDGLSASIERGVMQAGPILIITACGGAYGSVLKATPLADALRSWAEGSGAGGAAFLLVAFGVASLFKTAQGSTTAAMAIASSLLGSLAPAAGFQTGPELALVVCSIGAGAMVVSHVNDSYYWIVCQFGSISPAAGLRTQTATTALMGVAALTATLLLYLVLQLVG